MIEPKPSPTDWAQASPCYARAKSAAPPRLPVQETNTTARRLDSRRNALAFLKALYVSILSN